MRNLLIALLIVALFPFNAEIEQRNIDIESATWTLKSWIHDCPSEYYGYTATILPPYQMWMNAIGKKDVRVYGVPIKIEFSQYGVDVVLLGELVYKGNAIYCYY